MTTISDLAIPAVGLGLWKIAREDAAAVVIEALKEGYRHLDSACDYGNELEVGAGLTTAFESGVCTREDVWVTSKLWNTYHDPAHVKEACLKTLTDLGLDYLDLYLIHFPIALKPVDFEAHYPPGWFHDPNKESPRMELASVPLHETWAAMESLVEKGLVKHIGVCNYNSALIHDLMAYAKIKPAMLQVELHPYLTQPSLMRTAAQYGITVTGFSPLGASSYLELSMANEPESVLREELIKEIACRHRRTPAQVVLRWGIQRGTAVIPKSSKSSRRQENLAVFDFELNSDEMESISALNRGRRFNNPADFCEGAFNTFHAIYE
ncbi:MAG: aldo/keto reductase [Woeseiaceae bacterium]|nr:aldo/keto reductase [Woeseiaceae bacterium]